MRAIVLEGFDSSPALREVPPPQIAPNEVLVRVHASSVNPVDGAIAAGMMSGMVEHEFPVVLGRDYAGVVDQAGSDVTRYAEGEEVYGFVPAANPTVHEGTWAELIVVPEDNFVAGKPAGVEFAEAGAAPLSGITALSALDALDVSEGDTVLVVGANGGVGSFFVQLAANAGATVIAPALPEDEDYLREIGVSEVLDRDADVAALVRALPRRHRGPAGPRLLRPRRLRHPRGGPQGRWPRRLIALGSRRRIGAPQRHGDANPGQPRTLG